MTGITALSQPSASHRAVLIASLGDAVAGLPGKLRASPQSKPKEQSR